MRVRDLTLDQVMEYCSDTQNCRLDGCPLDRMCQSLFRADPVDWVRDAGEDVFDQEIEVT